MHDSLQNIIKKDNMMDYYKVLGGIILFNPDINRLKENIDAIKPQVDTLILIENGSKDLSYREQLREYTDVLYIQNKASMGIAYALNQILGYAYTHGYNWALTLDQDSVVTENMIDVYKSLVKDDTGIIGCWVEDRSFKRDQSWGLARGTIEINWFISSASFTRVEAWKKSGGFDTDMFIDWVDWDFGESIRQSGYKILKTWKTKLIHELGHNTRLVRVRKHEMQVMNHSVFRYYHFFRNRLYMARKYKHIGFFWALKENCFQMYTILKYEQNKIEKLMAFFKASFTGLFYPRVKRQHIKPEFLSLEAEKI